MKIYWFKNEKGDYFDYPQEIAWEVYSGREKRAYKDENRLTYVGWSDGSAYKATHDKMRVLKDKDTGMQLQATEEQEVTAQLMVEAEIEFAINNPDKSIPPKLAATGLTTQSGNEVPQSELNKLNNSA